MTEQKQNWRPSPEQRAVLERLKALADLAGSQEALCKAHSELDFGPTKLSKVLAVMKATKDDDASYFDDIKPANIGREIDNIREAVELIEAKLARGERREKLKICNLSAVRAVVQAVRDCADEESPRRLIKYLAPTGGGKSILAAHLAESCKARVVEARSAWKRSYFAVLHDLAGAIGMRIGDENRPSVIETALINFLAGRKMVLVIDEGEFFGKEALDGLRLLLNKTRVVIVICAIAEAHDRWNRWFALEADQLKRRTHETIHLQGVTPEDAAMFFPKGQFDDAHTALEAITKEASVFGSLDMVRRIEQKLQGVSKATAADVKKAIESARRAMRSERGVK